MKYALITLSLLTLFSCSIAKKKTPTAEVKKTDDLFEMVKAYAKRDQIRECKKGCDAELEALYRNSTALNKHISDANDYLSTVFGGKPIVILFENTTHLREQYANMIHERSIKPLKALSESKTDMETEKYKVILEGIKIAEGYMKAMDYQVKLAEDSLQPSELEKKVIETVFKNHHTGGPMSGVSFEEELQRVRKLFEDEGVQVSQDAPMRKLLHNIKVAVDMDKLLFQLVDIRIMKDMVNELAPEQARRIPWTRIERGVGFSHEKGRYLYKKY